MPENHFCKNLGPFSLSKIAEVIGTDIPLEYKDILIHGVNSLTDANESELAVLSNPKYKNDVYTCKAAACLVPLNFTVKPKTKTILLPVANPYHSYALIIDLFYAPALQKEPGIMPTAFIAKSAQI